MKKKILALLIMASMMSPVYSLSLDQATFKVGFRFFEQKSYTEAEARFLDIVRKYPDSSHYRESLWYLGQLYNNKGNHKSALQYYKILLSKSRSIQEKQQALLGIAKSWLQLGDHGKAADFYAFYALEYPESEHAPAALYFSGIAREREDNISAAIEKYRVILNDYSDSKYYAKAIEKIAVLDNTTPESLFTEGESFLTREEKSDTPLVGEDNDFSPTDFRAESSDPQYSTPTPVAPVAQALNTQLIQSSPQVITQLVQSPPQVITQIVQSPPEVITQMVQSPPEIITQTVQSSPEVITQMVPSLPQITPASHTQDKSLPSEIQEMIDSSVVYFSNDQYVPAESIAQATKKTELEAYRKLWEEEYALKLQEQELKDAQSALKEMASLTVNKAEMLEIKEKSLQEKQNQLRSALYNDLKALEQKESFVQDFNDIPSFIQVPSPNAVIVDPTPPVPPAGIPQEKITGTAPTEEALEVAEVTEGEAVENVDTEEYEYEDGEYVDVAYEGDEYYEEEYYE